MMKEMSRAPGQFKVSPGGGKFNQDQECARRRQFYARHGAATGGGPIWQK